MTACLTRRGHCVIGEGHWSKSYPFAKLGRIANSCFNEVKLILTRTTYVTTDCIYVLCCRQFVKNLLQVFTGVYKVANLFKWACMTLDNEVKLSMPYNAD